jgi:NAD(P)-dependent dehydrogenase (short-subunit alcohol dehydrogenase family)
MSPLALDAGLALFRVDGKVAIVTGGGGALGTAMARGLAGAGAALLIADRDAAAAEATAAGIVADGGQAVAQQVDVTDESAVADTVRQAVEGFGRLDILINAAGIGARAQAVDYPLDRWRQVLEVNLTGSFLFCREAGRLMCEQREGRIVNIASIAGLVGYRGNPAYLASKGGVVQLTRALAAEWAPHRVRVNAIAPGVIETQMVAGPMLADPEFYAWFRERHPLGFGQANQIVGPALFLCSDASSYVSGHILAVDGGYTAM